MKIEIIISCKDWNQENLDAFKDYLQEMCFQENMFTESEMEIISISEIR
jgi:hypothetical protein